MTPKTGRPLPVSTTWLTLLICRLLSLYYTITQIHSYWCTGCEPNASDSCCQFPHVGIYKVLSESTQCESQYKSKCKPMEYGCVGGKLSMSISCLSPFWLSLVPNANQLSGGIPGTGFRPKWKQVSGFTSKRQ